MSSDANLLNDLREFDPPSPIPPNNSMHLAFQANPNGSNFPGSVGPERRVRNNVSPPDFSRRSHYSSSIADSTDLDSLSVVTERRSLNRTVQDIHD